MKNTALSYEKRPVMITLLVTAAILSLVFTVFAVLEYSRSKRDLVSMLHEEGTVLLETLRASGERNVLAYEALERLTQQRLLSSGRLIEALDDSRPLSVPMLNRLAREAGLYRIHILDAQGRLVRSSRAQGEGDASSPRLMQSGIVDFIKQGGADTLVVGLQRDENRPLPRYAVVCRRRRGGGIVVTADARRLLALRRELGPGRLIQEIGRLEGMAYVVLQDTLGLVLASRGVEAMNRLKDDAFLMTVHAQQAEATRFFTWRDAPVFEVAGAFVIDEEPLGLFRIGLEAAHYRHILGKVRVRLVFIVLFFMAMGVTGIGFWVARENARTATASYLHVKTYTGEILQRMREAVVVVDGRAVVTVFNHAAENLFGLCSKQAIGQPLARLEQPVLEILQTSLTQGQNLERPLVEVVLGGEKRVLTLRTSFVEGDEGDVQSVILVATDLSVQAALESALRQKEKMTAMGKLASGVAHELRNPINAMGMIAQRFLKEFRPAKDVEEYEALAKTMVSETRRSNAIIQRFLQFARPAELNRTPVSMTSLLHNAADVMRSRAAAERVGLNVSVKDEAVLTLDRDQMKQALINLLQNGLDASRSTDEMVLCGRLEHGAYRIDIQDQGEGITPETQRHIFDLYYSTKPDGLGMGLALVHQIVQRHGGRVEVQSAVGQGTTFTLWLQGERS